MKMIFGKYFPETCYGKLLSKTCFKKYFWEVNVTFWKIFSRSNF